MLPLVLFLGAVMASDVLGAQVFERSDRARYQAVRAEGTIEIDGVLDEAVWEKAPVITGLVQRDPLEGEPATQPTRVRVVFDDDAIYFGAELDDAQPVTTQLGRRDSELKSDWFRIYLDPHLDRRTGAGFAVNPSNVQQDFVLYNDNWDDTEWDAVWSSATKVHERGWTVEVRIPYSQLRFPRRDRHVWGINLIRDIVRNNESARLVFVPKTDSGFVSRFADLEGIEGIEPKRAIEIMPYVLSRLDYSETVSPSDPFRSTTESEMTAGLDLKVGLTPNLTLTGTINPDFGQVEVDPAEVNLSQFELFYPEKRPFFIEGSSLFEFGRGGSNNNFNINNFPPILFYSRRIGRSPQGLGAIDYDHLEAPGETTILGAAKLTGKTANGWTIAALDAFTRKETASFTLGGVHDEAVVEPATNYFVGRFAREFPKSHFGTLFTAVNRNLDPSLDRFREEAYLAGIDGHWAFGDRDSILEGFLAVSHVGGSREAILATQRSPAHYYQRPDADHVDLDPEATSLDGWGGRLTWATQKGKWRWNLQAQGYSPGFETNDAGYLQRADYAATHAVVLFNDPEPRGLLRRRNVWIAKWQNWNWDGDLISNGIGSNAGIVFRNYWWTGLELFHTMPRLDDRATRGGPLVENPGGTHLGGGFDTDSRRPVYFRFWGWVEDDAHDAWERGTSVKMVYRPTPALRLEIEPRYSRSDSFSQYVTQRSDPLAIATHGGRYVFSRIEQESIQLGTRLEWTFNSRLSLQLYLQPYIAAGDYYEFKELARPRTDDYLVYGADAGTIARDPETGEYVVDPDGSGASSPFRFSDPDFNFRSLRGSAVLRWEFRPGSAMYLVWNENRADVAQTGEFRPSKDFDALADVPADDVLMLKVSYWFGR
ncbi:MAG: DUF5916 domain-containing protein [Thermoanaerobaculia bacterium]